MTTNTPQGSGAPAQQGYAPQQAPQNAYPQQGMYGTPYAQAYVPSPPKSTSTYVILGILLGAFGVHNFYAGYTGKAVAQLLISLLSCFCLSPVSGIWALIEACTVRQDAQGVPFV